MGSSGKTLIDKVWDAHTITTGEGGDALLFVDRHLVHDGSFQAFEQLVAEQRTVRRPDCTISTVDHYVPTAGGRSGFVDKDLEQMVLSLEESSRTWNITHFGLGDQHQGIVHVIGPELGITQPGILIVCGDSHTSTHGALGAFSFGIGSSEVAHVLATQTLWQKRPKTMRVNVNGTLPIGVTSKDLALYIISKIGASGATGHAIEYTGDAIADLSMEARMTLCNMAIEAGSKTAIVPPDSKTFKYLHGRPFSPRGQAWHDAVSYWETLKSDADAPYDHSINFEATEVAPTVTWGTSPQDAVAVTGRIPNPDDEPDQKRREHIRQALAYMNLVPNAPMTEVAVDRVFIGSCTNSRVEDLEAAARVAKGRKAVVPALVVPGSQAVKRLAEAKGLDKIFLQAGFEWRDPGCSMCVAMNGLDVVPAGQRCASTSNRNFVGRQGRGARTHLMSPAMAAAAAICGHITDVRDITWN
ncbi:MAG TPA: 3-isopropylmalate dehydratase large subunit [Gammaproteobacteria bacterium]|nr:3-isopropylmalate dehydratase large subunit [Gammaproteobacteria bacterium]